MAMTKQTYSINALATELGRDRRTIARELEGLRPAETRKVGQRQEKRWFLADVLKHMDRHNAGEPDAKAMAEAESLCQDFCSQQLYQHLIRTKEFECGLTGYARAELGLDKARALDLLAHVAYRLLAGINEVFGADLKFEVADKTLAWDWQHARNDGRAEAFLKERWPDKEKK